MLLLLIITSFDGISYFQYHCDNNYYCILLYIIKFIKLMNPWDPMVQILQLFYHSIIQFLRYSTYLYE